MMMEMIGIITRVSRPMMMMDYCACVYKGCIGEKSGAKAKKYAHERAWRFYGARPPIKGACESNKSSTQSKPHLRFIPGASPSWEDIYVLGRKLVMIVFWNILHQWSLQMEQRLHLLIILRFKKMWTRSTLVGYIIGNKPFFPHIEACVGRIWKPDCS